VGGEKDVNALLRGMQPVLHTDRFVFATTPHPPTDIDAMAWIREDEGITVVATQKEADRAGLIYDFVAARITLQVHSSLDAVGLTAVVAATLADAGISCNVVAGYYHDHVFVRAEDGSRAQRLLLALSAATG